MSRPLATDEGVDMSKMLAKYTTRGKFLRNGCIAVLAISYLGVGFGVKAGPTEDPAATHNMLVIGEKTVFLSHLPMFGASDPTKEDFSPHRFQVIAEAMFTDKSKNVQDAYAEDRQKHPNMKMYTLNPEKFVLSRLAASNGLSSFRGTIFRGHLERPGNEKILEDNVIDVKKVIHFQEFDPRAKKPSQLEYLLFGKGNEVFLAHLITQPPDFDQILAVKVTGHAFTDEELAKGLQVIFPGTTNAPAKRIRQKQRAVGEIKLGSDPAPKRIQVEARREFYFEEGELRLPPTFKATVNEKRAGFP
jgi:hypothetical protein